MNYMGIDQHNQYCYMTIMDKEGNVLKSDAVWNDRDEIKRFLDGVGGETKAVVEAGRASYRMVDLLEEMDVELMMADPAQVKAIAYAKIKTDKRDSKVLADLLRTNLIPEVYMRSKDNREAQRLLHQRAHFVRMRTQVKNRIRWLLAQQDEQVSQQIKEGNKPFSRKGINFLTQIPLSELDRKLLDELLVLYENLDERVRKSDKLVEMLHRGMKEAQFIGTVPGFGPFFSVLVAIEIGDINRFANAEKLHAYAGVIPSTHSSGGKIYHGKIIKSGNRWLRWAAVEAVWPAIKSDFQLRAFYEKHARRKGNNVAKVITARKLLSIIYRVLKENRPYELYRRK